jgi:hypothetical protein
VSFSGLITSESGSAFADNPCNSKWTFFLGLWARLGHNKDPISTQMEGSEDKDSCAGVASEAELLSLPLIMRQRVMGPDDREVLYWIMQRGMSTARQRRRSILHIIL